MPPRKLNIVERANAQIDTQFDPFVVGDVNDYQVKVAKFGPEFDWHAHEEEDEAFFILSGTIAIDFRDGTVTLDEGDFLIVPKTTEHRPRALTDNPIVLMFEPATTINTGDVESDLTQTTLRRLSP